MIQVTAGIVLLLGGLCGSAIRILQLHLKTPIQPNHLQRIQWYERLFFGLVIVLLIIPAYCFFRYQQTINPRHLPLVKHPTQVQEIQTVELKNYPPK